MDLTGARRIELREMTSLSVILFLNKCNDRAIELYRSAKTLVDSVIITDSNAADVEVLKNFSTLFADKIVACSKSKSDLYGLSV